jgi:hypothetical protein
MSNKASRDDAEEYAENGWKMDKYTDVLDQSSYRRSSGRHMLSAILRLRRAGKSKTLHRNVSYHAISHWFNSREKMCSLRSVELKKLEDREYES